MRFWKGLGGLLVFLGCLAALMGILATVAPMIDNDQVRRIIESFSIPSHDPILSGVNAAILFCMRNNYLLFAVGAAAMLAGGLTRAAVSGALPKDEDDLSTREPVRERRPVAVPVTEPAHTRPTFPKRDQALSPYTAAAYGKALSGGQSDIAAKYMPRSIITTPEVDAASPARPAAQPSRAAAPEAYAKPEARVEPDWKLGETVRCRACGANNPWQAAFCDQCGRRLTEGVADSAAASVETLRPEAITDVREAYAPPEGIAKPRMEGVQPETFSGREQVYPATPEQVSAAAEGSFLKVDRGLYEAGVSHGSDAATPPRALQEPLPTSAAMELRPARAPSPAMTRAAGIHARPLIVSTLRLASTDARVEQAMKTDDQPRSGQATGATNARPRIISTIGKRSTR